MPEYGVSTRVHIGTSQSVPPNKPATPTATEVTSTSVTLSLTATTVPEGGAPLIGYYIYKDGVQVLTVEAFNLNPMITGLSPGPAVFTVSAYNANNPSGESLQSDPLSVTLPGALTLPDAPANLRFVSRGATSAVVEWDAATAPEGDPVTTYRVRRVGLAGVLATATAPTTTATITGLGSGDQLQVNAYNTAGASPRSNVITFTPNTATSNAVACGLVQDTWSIAYLAQNAGTKYTNYTLGKSVMADLGVKNMRGRFILANSAINNFIREAAEQHGIKFLARFGAFEELPGGHSPATLVAALVTEFGPNAQNPTRKVSDYIYAIEGLNEPNNNHVPWIDKTIKYTRETWEAYSATPEVQDIPLMGPALARVNASTNAVEGTSTAEQARNLALAAESVHGQVGRGLDPWTTMGVMHIYPRGATPSTDFNFFYEPHRLLYPPPMTISTTEGGYFTDMLYVGGSNVTPEPVAALYHDRHVMEHVIRGTRWFNQHELWDGDLPQNPDAKKRREESFGLKRADQTNKPGYLTMRRFQALMEDEYASTQRPKVDYVPASLAGLGVSPAPGAAGSTTNRLRGFLAGHSDGSYRYLVWRDENVAWATTPPYTITPKTPINVTVSLPSARQLTAYVPSKQEAPTMATRTASSITVPVSDGLTVVKIV